MMQRLPFIATPATGWWGAGYFRSAGSMEGMEEEMKKNGAVSERKTFNEDDQASLYMLVRRVGGENGREWMMGWEEGKGGRIGVTG